jgi:alpha-glucosidase
VTVAAEWGRPVVFVCAGSVVPVNLAAQHFAKPADERGFEIYPSRRDDSFEGSCFEDDGESFADPRGNRLEWRLRADAFVLRVSRQGDASLVPSMQVRLLLPLTDLRKIECERGQVVSESLTGTRREVVLQFERRTG